MANLAVLCLEHHNDAHTTSTLSQNLTPDVLRTAKRKWENEVKTLDARSIVDALLVESSQWAYINELRLFELVDEYQIDVCDSRYYRGARAVNLVNELGQPRPTSADTFYKYEGPNILLRYAYMKDVLLALIERLPVVNISDHLDRGVLLPTIVPGDFIFVEGAHTFARLRDIHSGPGQLCSGHRTANNVRIQFTFDKWEATSSSASAIWLSGKKRAGSLLQIKDVSREKVSLVLSGTVLAISSFTSQLKNRDYAARWINWRPRRRRHPPRVIQI